MIDWPSASARLGASCQRTISWQERPPRESSMTSARGLSAHAPNYATTFDSSRASCLVRIIDGVTQNSDEDEMTYFGPAAG